MDFSLTGEQQMIVESTRRFVEEELYPYEDEVEELDEVRPELRQQIVARAKEQGFYAANMPEEHGGGGLDDLSLILFSREMG
ncbi:MAG TPA: acyl-CoA dehydrogenase family protein, partial [Kiloniellaceae bacterium]|nr:acyl-CoA dehydrogenase family protein [Kiloniellaceae bacterium]